MKGKIVYRDVTHDPDAELKANHAPELREALVNCGFKRVGLVEARISDTTMLEQLRQSLSGPDADWILEAIEGGEVDEVLTSPDQRAFASVEQYSGGPIVCLRTILENGTVVETTTKPKRSPQTRVTIPGLSGDGSLVTQMVAKSMSATMDGSSLWPRQDWPRSGYHLELIATGDVKALWQRHQQRVNRVLGASNTNIRPHNSIPLYLCICHRAHGVMEFDARRQGRARNWISLLIVLLLAAFPVALLLFRDVIGPLFKSSAGDGPSLALILMLVLFPLLMAVTPLLGLPLMMRFARATILPRLPGLELRPVSDLLGEVPKILSSAPYSPSQSATRPGSQPRSRSAFNTERGSRGWFASLIVTGLFIGSLVTPTSTIIFSELNVIWGIVLIGFGTIIGTIGSLLFMLSRMRAKEKVIAGATIGAGTAASVILIMPLINIGGPLQKVIGGIIGGIVAAGVGWAFNDRERPQPDR